MRGKKENKKRNCRHTTPHWFAELDIHLNEKQGTQVSYGENYGSLSKYFQINYPYQVSAPGPSLMENPELSKTINTLLFTKKDRYSVSFTVPAKNLCFNVCTLFSVQ